MDTKCEDWIPFGTKLAMITKKYFGVLAQSFKHIDLERYYSVLLFLDNQSKAVSQQCIADFFKIDKAQMVRIVDYLTKSGLISKKQNSQNRREYLVTLTDKAILVLPEMKNTIDVLNQKMFAGFTEQNKKEFCEMLSNIAGNLELEPAVSMNLEINPFKHNK